MKTKIHYLIAIPLIMGACTSSYRAGVSGYDDLYYTPSDARIQSELAQTQVEARTPAQTEQNYQLEELSDYEKYRQGWMKWFHCSSVYLCRSIRRGIRGIVRFFLIVFNSFRQLFRQPYPEVRPFFRLGFDCYRSAVLLDDLIGDKKAKPGAPVSF